MRLTCVELVGTGMSSAYAELVTRRFTGRAGQRRFAQRFSRDAGRLINRCGLAATGAVQVTRVQHLVMRICHRSDARPADVDGFHQDGSQRHRWTSPTASADTVAWVGVDDDEVSWTAGGRQRTAAL
jgi:hypothetical protein